MQAEVSKNEAALLGAQESCPRSEERIRLEEQKNRRAERKIW